MNRGCPLEKIVTRGVELGAYPGATLVVMQGQRVIADIARFGIALQGLLHSVAV